MKRLILFFVCIAVLQAQKLEYHASVGYYYDSNIAQNITEYGKNYAVPKLGATYNFVQAPLFITTNLAYDFYIAEWDIDESSPFLEAQFGAKIENNNFRYIPEFSYKLFLVNHVYLPEDHHNELFWQPLFQLFELNNKFRIKKKKNEYHLSLSGAYYDFGEGSLDTVLLTHDKEGFYLTLTPKYKRILKVKKRDNVKVSEFGFKGKYRHAFLKSPLDSYNYWALSTNMDMKLFYPFLSLEASYAEKYYLGEEEHPHTGEHINVKKQYLTLIPSLSIPLVKDLSLEVAGEFTTKFSNLPEHNYQRNIFSVTLLWDSSIKYKKKL